MSSFLLPPTSSWNNIDEYCCICIYLPLLIKERTFTQLSLAIHILSLSLSLSLSLFLSFFLSFFLSLSLSFFLSQHPYFCFSVRLSVSSFQSSTPLIYVRKSLQICVCVSIYLHVLAPGLFGNIFPTQCLLSKKLRAMLLHLILQVLLLLLLFPIFPTLLFLP